MGKIKDIITGIKKHKILMIIGILIIGFTFYFGYNRNEIDENEDEQIETATVRKGNIELVVTGSGQINAVSQIDLRPQIAGDGLDITQVVVKNDQEVKENDLIAVLDTTEPQKDVRDAELGLRSAEINLKQTEDQYPKETEKHKHQRQLKEISVSQAVNRLAEARESLSDYSIRAPFDGIVTGLSVEVGDSIARDEILASIITREMNAAISLNEVDAIKVDVDNKVDLEFDAIEGLEINGTVSKIDTIGTVDQGVVYYNAEISFDSTSIQKIKPGMSVNAEILVQSKKDILLVSNVAVKSDEEGDYVEVINQEGQITQKSVETGISDDINTEIIQGIKEKDIVVTKRPTTLSNNAEKLEESDDSRGLFDSALQKGPGGKTR